MKIFNTLTGTKDDFQPLGDVVKMYVCGITPYAESHVGHAMSYIIFDTIIRYLRYRGYGVRHVQNFTDIDDKIIARAQRLNVAPRDLAERYIVEFYDNMAALNVHPADRYVRATEVIPKIIEIIEGLIAKNYAYPVDGDVYFRVNRDDDYGKLSHRSQDELLAGARIEVDPRKESPMDFALWKAAKPGEPSWESPWGPGRPGWHIECSAIILQHLGDQIDIHGGGQDLIFPHHENEIAQSESCTGHTPFVRYWIHNGLLQLGEQKMSKSLGNLVTIREALAAHSSDALRHFVLTSHYRSPLTYTDEALEAAERGVERLRSAIEGYDPSTTPAPHAALESAAQSAKERFIGAMDDDFNSPAALAALFDLAREINRARDAGASQSELATGQAVLQELARVLGFTLEAPTREVAAAPFIDLLIQIRRELRGAKQYALADQIRAKLGELGVTIEDRAEGTVWKLGR